MTKSANNLVSLVTGANGALGKAVIDRFLRAEQTVVGVDLTTGSPQKNLHWQSCDLSKLSDVEKLAKDLNAQGLVVRNIVHCAGGFRFNKIEDHSEADFDFLLNSNLRSTFNILKTLLPGMKSRKEGRIVLVGSKSVLQSPAGMSVYLAAKSGVHQIVMSVAEEVKALNININAVLPSILDTPANRQMMPDADFKSWVKLEELSEIIFSLTQNYGNAIRGALIPVVGQV